MRLAGITTLVIALLLGAFCYWGMFTRAGNRRFDEMAGMIPMGAGLLGGVMFLAACVLLFLSRR